MPKPTLAQAIVEVLAEHGVHRMFGVPGGGSSLDLIDAAAKLGIDFVLTHTETAGAIMASVTGELSDTPGVVLTGIGPGAASVVNGVAYASLERSPLIVLTDCHEPDPHVPSHQSFDQCALFAPLAKATHRLRPTDGRAMVERLASSAMRLPRGPVHIDLSSEDAAATMADRLDPPAEVASPVPMSTESLSAARALLSGCRRPLIIAGLQARDDRAAAGLERLAAAWQCPVMTTYKAKGTLSDAHPNLVGLFTGAAADTECVQRSDCIVCYGLDTIELIPNRWCYEAPVVVLAAGPGSPPPFEPAVALQGRLCELAANVLDALSGSDWNEAEIEFLRASASSLSRMSGRGHTAETVVRATQTAAPRDCRATVDSGAHMFAAMALLRAEGPYDVLKSNGLSTMGFALPAAIASSLEQPERPVLAFTGDGGIAMCLAELATAARHECRIMVVVLNDAALSLIDIKQQRQQRPSMGVRYPAVDYAGAATALGCRGFRVGPDERLEPTLGTALSERGPALIDVQIDPAGYADQLSALRG